MSGGEDSVVKCNMCQTEVILSEVRQTMLVPPDYYSSGLWPSEPRKPLAFILDGPKTGDCCVMIWKWVREE